MSQWNRYEEDYSSGGYRQDVAYQNGIFDDYAMPNRQVNRDYDRGYDRYDRGYDRNYDRGYDRGNLAMSVSLGPVDFLLGSIANGGNGAFGIHSGRYGHHQGQQWGRQTYLTPDYNYRRGYEDFGESSYNVAQGYRPQTRFGDSFRQDIYDSRFHRHHDRNQMNFDLRFDGGRQYQSERYSRPYIQEDYRSYERERYVEPRPRMPEREYVQENYDSNYLEETVQTERTREVQTDDRPTRTLPTNAMSEYDWAVYTKLCNTAEGLIGKRTTDYDKRVPTDRLGCVKAVSLLVDQAFGYDTNDVNTRTFEKNLRNKGFAEVAVSDIKPGDVILGYRADGDYSHAALYMGNGKIFNNDSDAGTMQIQSIDKFNSTEYKRFVILRHPPKVPGVTGVAEKSNTATGSYEADAQMQRGEQQQLNVDPEEDFRPAPTQSRAKR